ncbi:MAG: FHA domain-containing protein [Acidiferrobacteraceae bacterium]
MKFMVMDQGRVIADIPLKSGNITIGRRKDSDICLDHPAVSGQHAVVWSLDGQAFIRDLVSTNGTLINGSKITKQHLRPGDRIAIGPYDLHYLLETPGAADTTADEHALNQCLVQHPALFVLSGPASGRRIDLVKPITHLGKTGQHAGAIVRTADGFRLTGQTGVIRLNGKPLDENGALLNSGDLIDVSDARLQFHAR